MHINWRKLYVAAIALQIVIAAYLLITFLQGKSQIEISRQVQPAASSEDVNDISSVGTLGLGTVEKARYVTFGDDKKISREFGFEKLLHKEGRQWEISKPYINIYQDDFKCKLTAQKGTILTDETSSNVDLLEAKLEGDVKIKIVPVNNVQTGNIEAFLDDIVFIRERSLFITYGPVKIISRDAQVLGKGLEIVYDTAKNKLYLLKITKLDSLCINQIQKQSILGTEQTSKSIKDENKTQNNNQSQTHGKYRAVFTNNVKVNTQDNMVFVKGLLAIHNIIGQGNTSEDKKNEPNEVTDAGLEPINQQELLDLYITCDGGLVVNPMENDIKQLGILEKTGDKNTTLDLEKDTNQGNTKKSALWSTDLDYDVQSQEAAVTGPAKIAYYIPSEQPGIKPDVLTVTADDVITYDYYKGLIYFRGNCVCSLETHKNNKSQKYTVKSPVLAISLQQHPDSNQSITLKQITADGGANISLLDMASNTQTASITSERIDYDALQKQIMTSGPSVLNINPAKSNVTDSRSQINKLIVTANKQILYDDLTNTILFDGNCHCEMFSDDQSDNHKYTLDSERILIELVKAQGRENQLAADGIKRIEAAEKAHAKILAKDSEKPLAEFSAMKIEFDAHSNEVAAPGPSRLVIFSDTQILSGKKIDSPTIITAQKKTSFLPGKNQAVFEGDCSCSLIRVDSGVPRKYILKAPAITVNIGDTNSKSVANGIKSLNAGDKAVITVTPLESSTELAKFTASSIEYIAKSDNITAKGPCDFSFYANDFMPAQTLGAALPVHINAKDSTEFLQSENKIIFKGDCLCTMVKTKTNFENKYTLSADTISLDLVKQNKSEPAMSTLEIEKISARGKLVHLANITTESNRLIGFSKLKCKSIMYDSASKTFSANGPGIITIDNSKIYVEQPKTDRITFTKKCYAFLRDFEKLSYHLEKNYLKAQNIKDKILVDYFPITKNQQEQQQVKASASTIEIQLSRSEKGENEISAVKASGGITYEDTDNQFVAGQMLYDGKTSLVKASAGGTQRCYLNGAIIDNILYDVNKAAIVNIDVTNPGRIGVK